MNHGSVIAELEQLQLERAKLEIEHQELLKQQYGRLASNSIF